MRTDGLTDRYDEPNNRFSQFCERAEKVNTLSGEQVRPSVCDLV
jgi:hypothetical protein